jgi:hypothetical protein
MNPQTWPRVAPQLAERIVQLPLGEQLWLLEQLARRIRENLSQPTWESQLLAMAADPEIQNELRQIDREFAGAEADGLAIVG